MVFTAVLEDTASILSMEAMTQMLMCCLLAASATLAMKYIGHHHREEPSASQTMAKNCGLSVSSCCQGSDCLAPSMERAA